MSPILGARGGLSASAYGFTSSVLVPGDYESIATAIVGSGGAPSVTFNTIPSTYKHLQIRAIAKAVNNDQGYFLQINGDTAANYNTHYMFGTGSGTPTSASNNTWGGIDVAVTSSSNFSGMVIDILDYSDINKNKTVRTLSGNDNNGSGYIFFSSGLWRNTAAITSLTIRELLGGGNITEYSSFALYGIKG